MTSAAAKREEIQLRLQKLREEREREQAAFDAIAAAHPELSAQEITALAQQEAVGAAPQSIVLDGREVSVGDKVTVKDDVQLLHRVDRGHFGPDVLKPIYCGEPAEVVRVMESFQGKPAMELRFADGVTKVFFTECIVTDAARGGRSDGAAAAHTKNACRADAADVPIFMPPARPLPPSPGTVALPGWDQLCRPRRKHAGGYASVAAQPTAPSPPPPPTAAAIQFAKPPPGVAKATSDASPAPTAPPQASIPTAPRDSASPAKPLVVTSPTMKETLAKASKTSPSAARAGSSPSLSLLSSPPAIPVTDRPSAAPSSSSNPRATRQSSAASPAAVFSPSMKRVPELHRTPDSTEGGCAVQLAAALPNTVEEEQGEGDSISPAGRQLPQVCAATYQAKYELQDGASRIPRRQSDTAPASGTQTCWVCGLIKAEAPLSDPMRVTFPAHCTAMLSLFAALTRRLQWDRLQCAVSRLFTEEGIEIKSASAVRGGMRLVATAGCEYRPIAHPAAFSSVLEACPSSAATTRPVDSATKPTAPASPAGPQSAPVPAPHKSLVAPVMAAAATPKHSRPPPPLSSSPSAPNKPKHIRVYENGQYDDNVYRTVTVRPNYKTIGSLKTIITRELQWRDGKKVDLLFDACGAEVKDLDSICDGDVVVASAGERFAIPYPNTPMHLEAIQLSERLHPSRMC
ncbi:hypothetical protein ABL78_3185 [Leptomonas seymouri]|uniref:Doublecortin domain-containing protein n=1 Tax=Leptomonas seymouri TaxID=5684 RepID=A0A0N1PDR2_LEPSE|nr:hypothetical protein ABL78_3185 [Leptomonas seymouri]|eukprot:KPI87712.1 hypothetical protein ABL78_3185 [Leptomonas seymouri]